ncbi:MAG: hypothetical protein KGN01_05565 [Patescibacteria group bacterium]|nr:hypothetical protein [Patescibacteria group bacterium]
MYIQRSDGKFVLNPEWQSEECSYATEGDIVTLYLQNKSHLSRYLKKLFGKAKAEFIRKIGNLNIYNITLREPILIHSDDCLVTDSPALPECLLWYLTVPAEEFVNSKKRSNLLRFFVCGPSLKSPNFFNDVEVNFIKTEKDGLITLCRK